MNFIFTIIIVAVAAFIGTGSVYFFKFKEDNKIEEFCEEVIESQIDKDVDLSPDSPEKDYLDIKGEEDGNE